MMKKIIILALSLITISMMSNGCESFEPDTPTGVDIEVFTTLIAPPSNNHGNTIVFIEWDPLITADFSFYEISRKTFYDSEWTRVFTSSDPYTASYLDTVADDDDLIYRVSLITTDDTRIDQTDTLDNIELTHFFISQIGNNEFEPRFISYQDVMTGYNSVFVDNGDTLDVIDDTLTGMSWTFDTKSVMIRGANTILMSGSGEEPIVTIEYGILEGFEITGGYLERSVGVGLVSKGSSWVRRCRIYGNYTSYGKGAGLILSDNAIVSNCLIYSNGARPIIFQSVADGSFINNTVYNQDQEFTNIGGSFSYMNNIVYGGIMSFNSVEEGSLLIDYDLLFNVDIEGNVTMGTSIMDDDPLFMAPVSFYLSPSSPALNSGNPEQSYNNPDGSRNTLGYEGGPYGWITD